MRVTNLLNPIAEIVASLVPQLQQLQPPGAPLPTLLLHRDATYASWMGREDGYSADSLRGAQLLQATLLPGLRWLNQTEVAAQLHAALPNYHVGLGSRFEQDQAALAAAPRIARCSDLTLLVPPDDSRVMLGLATTNPTLLNSLKNQGVNVLQSTDSAPLPPDPATAQRPGLLILTGHRNADFDSYMRQLAAAGALRDKVVVVFSCNERGTTYLNSELLRWGGARQVIFYASRIDGTVVSDVLKSLADLLTANDTGAKKSQPIQDWFRAATAATRRQYEQEALTGIDHTDSLQQLDLVEQGRLMQVSIHFFYPPVPHG